jgi:hypothetical protein
MMEDICTHHSLGQLGQLFSYVQRISSEEIRVIGNGMSLPVL